MTTTQIDGHRQVKAATITNAEIASAAAIALSKLEEAVIQADGGQAFTADQSLGSHNLTNVADPVNNQDAATKAWVLANTGATTTAAAVRAATTANITLSGTQTVDGVALSAADRVLVKNQTAPAENGLYVVAAGAWARATDMDAWTEVPGKVVAVEEGTAQADTLWLSTGDLGGTLNTTAVTFVQIPGPSDILAGNGLTRTGQSIDVVAGNGLSAGANQLDLTLDGTTLSKSGSGLKVADAGVTGTQLAAAVAGAGLAGGAGSALSVNVDGSTLEIATDTLQVKDGGITAAKLAQTYIQVSKYIVRETPTGSVNGSNTSFGLANTPVAGTEQVFLNGILQEPGAGNDYTISSATITYLTAPATGDRLRVTYLAS